MASTPAPLTASLSRFAAAMHTVADGHHHIASPLGAWLLVALAAATSQGSERKVLTDVLCMDVDLAAGVAADLLANPHPAVGSAAGIWIARDASSAGPSASEGLRTWLERVPAVVDTGAIPPQPWLDEWACQRSLGLVDRFPVTVDSNTMALLATVLAAKVTWNEPFRVVGANELGGPDSLAGGNRFALRTPETGHDQCIVATADIGDVAVHIASTAEGLSVYSVAADPAVPAAQVLARAYHLAAEHAAGRPLARRSLFDLPLGRTALWEITETEELVTAPDGRQERCTAVLPAWSARSEHDLDHEALGVPALASSLAKVLGLSEYAVKAKQIAVARYDRFGFEAAAVSGMAVLAGCLMPAPGLARLADLRFANPYAVVAVANADRVPGRTDGEDRWMSHWNGVPVFSAWVAESTEVQAEDGSAQESNLEQSDPAEAAAARAEGQIADRSSGLGRAA